MRTRFSPQVVNSVVTLSRETAWGDLPCVSAALISAGIWRKCDQKWFDRGRIWFNRGRIRHVLRTRSRGARGETAEVFRPGGAHRTALRASLRQNRFAKQGGLLARFDLLTVRLAVNLGGYARIRRGLCAMPAVSRCGFPNQCGGL